MSIRSGSSLNRNPASVRARFNGSSPTTNSVASGWCSCSQRVVVTTVFAMSEMSVGSPSRVSFSTYCRGSFVGLFDRKRTGIPRRRSSPINRAAPGSR